MHCKRKQCRRDSHGALETWSKYRMISSQDAWNHYRLFSYSNNKKPRVTKGSENQTKRSVASPLYRACNGCLAYCFRLFSLFKWAAWDQGNHQVLMPMIKRFSFYYLWSIPDSRAILHILKVSFQKRSSYFLTQRTATPRRPNSRMNSFYRTFKIIVSLNTN